MSYPARYISPCNLLTYASLCCSLMAVLAAREYRSWEAAGLLLAISALADTFDGKFARLFKRSESEKAFGAQLDSLVDGVSFGIVPVICLLSANYLFSGPKGPAAVRNPMESSASS